MKLTDTVWNGPACRFGDAHVFYVLHVLQMEGSLSRSSLADILGIGEGSARKIVDILREWGFINVRQTGVTLSEYGRKFMNDIPMTMVDVPRSDYVVGACQRAVLVRGTADMVSNGMYQRDRGIVAGADGASIFVMRDGAVIMPTSWDMDIRDPDFAGAIRRTGIRDGDVLAIAGSSDPDVASIAAIAIGLDML